MILISWTDQLNIMKMETTKLIRKITVGKDYKVDSMHYAVGQEVYGGHEICDIIEEKDNLFKSKNEFENYWRNYE